MPSEPPLEYRLVTHADMRLMSDGATVYDDQHRAWVKRGPWWHLNDGETRRLGTELKRLAAWTYALEPFNPHKTISYDTDRRRA